MMLDVQSVEAGYGSSQVLFGMTLRIGEGQVVSLMGRNGMGKTTTVKSILGVTPPRAGSICFDGVELRGRRIFQIAKLGIAIVPEGRQIFATLSVLENLVATAANRHWHVQPWTVGRVFDLFPSLAARARNLGSQLSGGEQQMLAIGRALMTNPRVLILDEATEGLSPLIRREIWKVLTALKAQGLSILVIDKNVGVLAELADWHYVIQKGRVVWEGDSANLLADLAAVQGIVGV
jgi:branched-chain amino acid transport system ATP-binding protein